MKNQLKNIKIDGFDKACKFYADMQEILDYIEQYAGPKIISTMQVQTLVVHVVMADNCIKEFFSKILRASFLF